MREDERTRIAIEGKFGQGKRRFGLDEISTKLPATSETTVSMINLVMNLEKRMADIFVLLFVWLKKAVRRLFLQGIFDFFSEAIPICNVKLSFSANPKYAVSEAIDCFFLKIKKWE